MDAGKHAGCKKGRVREAAPDTLFIQFFDHERAMRNALIPSDKLTDPAERRRLDKGVYGGSLGALGRT